MGVTMPLPDIVVTKSDKKSVPIIKWKVKESSFVDENNNPIEINPGILFDMEKIKSGYKWFSGIKGESPDTALDEWINGFCKAIPVPPPKAVNGEMKRWQRFVEIPCYNSKLGTRLFSFSTNSAYKSAQNIVRQWEENRSNQTGTCFLFKFNKVQTEPIPSSPTNNYVYPEFVFEQEISRPKEFSQLEEGTKEAQSNNDSPPF